MSANQLDISVIREQHFYCSKYRTAGKWVCTDRGISTFFYYDGEPYSLPFRAVFTSALLPSLKEAAILQMEEKIEDILLRSDGFESW